MRATRFNIAGLTLICLLIVTSLKSLTERSALSWRPESPRVRLGERPINEEALHPRHLHSLDELAQETLRFFLRQGRLPKTGELHALQEWLGLPIWDVQTQRLRFSSAPHTHQRLQLIETPHDELHHLGVAERVDATGYTLLMMEAPLRVLIEKTSPHVPPALHQEVEYRIELRAPYHSPSLIIADPSGSISASPLSAKRSHSGPLSTDHRRLNASWSTFEARLNPTERGRWALEVIAEGARGPTPLAQWSLYVEAPPPSALPLRSEPSPLITDEMEAERALWREILRARNERGLPPLSRDLQLTSIAQRYSQEQAQRRVFGHRSTISGGLKDRLYTNRYLARESAENIAFHRSIHEAHRGLMRSLIHRQNILSTELTHLGIGITRGPLPRDAERGEAEPIETDASRKYTHTHTQSGWWITELFSKPLTPPSSNNVARARQALYRRWSIQREIDPSELEQRLPSAPNPHQRDEERLRTELEAIEFTWGVDASSALMKIQPLLESREVKVWIHRVHTIEQLTLPPFSEGPLSHLAVSFTIRPRERPSFHESKVPLPLIQCTAIVW